MEIILAQKGKHQREFTRAAWDRLGKEKSGWSALPPEAQKGPKKKVIVPPPAKTPADTPQAKTVDQLRAELEAAIKAEEALENGPATDGPGEDGPKLYEGPFSNDEGTSWQAAVKHIKTLETAEAVNNYVPASDERRTVTGAKALRLEELKKN